MRNGKCWRHYDRIRRNEPNPTAPKDARKNGLDPFQRLFEAHLRLADMSTDEGRDVEYERAKDNFRKAAVRYAASLRIEALRKAQELAWKRGAQKGRPVGSYKPGRVSKRTREMRRLRALHREVISGALAQRQKPHFRGRGRTRATPRLTL